MKTRARKIGESAQDFAYHIILQNILSCVLAPGELINLQELSEELGVSRTPVREAVLRLERERIIEVFPQSGSMIAYVDFALADDAVFARRAIEQAVIEVVCQKATEKDLDNLSTNLELQKLYRKHDQPVEMLKVDNDFHLLLFTICGRENLLTSYSYASAQFDRIRNLRLSSIKDDKSLNEHRAILEAIQNRDVDSAKRAVAEHLSGYSMEERRMMMERYPEYFRPDDLRAMGLQTKAASR